MIIIETGNEFSDEFISHVDKKLKSARHKLRFLFGTELYICGSKVDGFYCEPDKELAITIDKGTDWISTLAHEFNHFVQKQSNSKVWKNLEMDIGNAYELWWEWIERQKELTKIQLEEVVRRIQDVEYECECNTIETIKEFNLPINLEEYILSSNSYLLFYQYAKKHRIWYSDNGTTKNDALFSHLPKTKMVDEYYHLPLEFEKYFKEMV